MKERRKYYKPTRRFFKCGKREEVIEVEALIEGEWCIEKADIPLLFLYTCCWSSVGDIRREAGIDKRNMLQHMNEQSYGHPGLGHPVPDRFQRGFVGDKTVPTATRNQPTRHIKH